MHTHLYTWTMYVLIHEGVSIFLHIGLHIYIYIYVYVNYTYVYTYTQSIALRQVPAQMLASWLPVAWPLALVSKLGHIPGARQQIAEGLGTLLHIGGHRGAAAYLLDLLKATVRAYCAIYVYTCICIYICINVFMYIYMNIIYI